MDGPIKYCNGFPDQYGQDVTNSMKVEKLEPIKNTGYWQVVTSGNQRISESLSTTVTTSTGHTLTQSQSDSIVTTMHDSFGYLGKEIDTTHTNQVTSEISNTLTSSVTRTCIATCPNENNEQVALFQWFTESDNVQGDGTKTSIATCFYQCRRGDQAQNPPSCPAGACKDSNCETCY